MPTIRFGVGPHIGLSAADECQGWLNGTVDTWIPADLPKHKVKPGGYTSQNFQDRWIFETLFSRHKKKGGTYVDVAANHYKRISNTYFFDQCLGWRGLCVEPNPIYAADLRAHRSCELVPTCASNSTAEIDLVLPPQQWMGGMGGVAGGTLAVWAKKSYPQSKWTAVTRRMRCIRLGDELVSRGFNHVDLMSLDVEGHEESVLRGVDFSRVVIEHILCENSPACDRVLRPLGYTSMRRPGEVGQPPELLYSLRRGSTSSVGGASGSARGGRAGGGGGGASRRSG